jgi:hypothetical protein
MKTQLDPAKSFGFLMSVNVLFMDMHDRDMNPLFHLPADRCRSFAAICDMPSGGRVRTTRPKGHGQTGSRQGELLRE